MKYRPEIDGLRTVAVVPVIFYHAGFNAVSGGYVGVDVFYVISGYLITAILLGDWEAGRFSIYDFYERRARRILPALVFVILVSLPFAYVLLQPDDLVEYAKSLMAVATFSSNIFFWLISGYFDSSTDMKPMLHTWSLAVEEQYYLLFPLLLTQIVRFGRGTRMTIIATLATLSLLAALYVHRDHPAAAFYLLPFRAWEILAGSLCAIHVQGRRLPLASGDRTASLIGNMLGAAGLVAIVLACVTFDDTTPAPSLHTLVPVIGTTLVILFAGPATVAGRVLALPPMVWVGLISYSAYLWHQPLMAFARHLSLEKLTPLEQIALPLASFALAVITYRYVETPFRKFRGFRRDTVFRLAVASILGVAATGYAGARFAGFPDRFSYPALVADARVHALQEERKVITRRGTCHFNRRANYSVADFLKNWDCADDRQMKDLRKIPAIVAGDSHAADVVMSLKLNGLAPMQMTGANCSLVPGQMSADCRRLFDGLLQRVGKDQTFTHLILANRMSPAELTPEAIADMASYWRRFDKEIVLFTAMPEFLNYERKIMRGITPHPNLEPAHLSSSPAIVQALADDGIHVIDAADLFCHLSEDCGVRAADGTLLMADDDHLSGQGAARFGHSMLDTDPVLRRVGAGSRVVELQDIRGTLQ